MTRPTDTGSCHLAETFHVDTGVQIDHVEGAASKPVFPSDSCVSLRDREMKWKQAVCSVTL